MVFDREYILINIQRVFHFKTIIKIIELCLSLNNTHFYIFCLFNFFCIINAVYEYNFDFNPTNSNYIFPFKSSLNLLQLTFFVLIQSLSYLRIWNCFLGLFCRSYLRRNERIERKICHSKFSYSTMNIFLFYLYNPSKALKTVDTQQLFYFFYLLNLTVLNYYFVFLLMSTVDKILFSIV